MIERVHGPGALVLVLAIAGCVAPTAPPAPRPAAPVPTPRFVATGLESVVGHDARQLEARFGRPDLDVREGTARKLQFSGPVCVLDAYLYPRANGGEPVVTYVDARLPDGRDIDRASCVAALGKQQEPQ